jgi:hypothetical protein
MKQLNIKISIAAIVLIFLLVIVGCGKPKFDDPNINDQYYVFLEDTETDQVISDQVMLTKYKNGTMVCGFALVESEEECYNMLEEVVYTELALLEEYLEHEIEQATPESIGTEEE